MVRASGSVFWRDVALASARLRAALTNLHADVVDLAIAFRRSEAQEILRVQFVGDARKRGTEILTESNLNVPAAGVFGDARKAWIRQVREQHRLKPTGTNARRTRSRAATAHRDGVDHDVLAPRAIDDLGLADWPLPQAQRTGVFSVAEHEDHRPPFVGRAKRRDRI